MYLIQTVWFIYLSSDFTVHLFKKKKKSINTTRLQKDEMVSYQTWKGNYGELRKNNNNKKTVYIIKSGQKM